MHNVNKKQGNANVNLNFNFNFNFNFTVFFSECMMTVNLLTFKIMNVTRSDVYSVAYNGLKPWTVLVK
jgi:hypothetical protein